MNKVFFYSILIILFYSHKVGYTQTAGYNKTYSLACHNCYEPQRAPNIEDVFNYTTTIELDIWDSEIFSGIATEIAGGDRMDHDWYVKHEPQQRGNRNCCGGTFKSCLNRIKTWSDNNKGHNVITVFIDKKENWSGSRESRRQEDLDNLILSVFPKGKLYTPSVLKGSFENLRVAAANQNWGSVDSLREKFIFILTDATEFTTKNKVLDQYLTSRKESAVCFVAPQISNESEIATPSAISGNNLGFIVFYNLEFVNSSLSNGINSLGFISRVFGAPETLETLNSLLNSQVNFVAMFNYKINSK